MTIPSSQPMIGQMLDWWALAGVDCLVDDEARSWLSPPPAERTLDVSHDAPKPAVNSTAAPLSVTEIRSPVAFSPAIPLPDNIDGFGAWLDNPAALPMLDPAMVRLRPRGTMEPRLLVLVDRPEEGDSQTGELLSGGAGRLLDAMMAAIGLEPTDIMVASLLPVYLAGGRVEPDWLPQLKAAALHLARLAAPKGLLILGDTTSRALIGSNVIEARQDLRDIQHDTGTLRAIATFHPRFLLQRPAAKALAWQDLQLLRKHLDS